MDLTKENQEAEFHIPTLGVNQVHEVGGTDGTADDEDPYVGKFNLMLDVVALYTDAPGSNHRVFPTGRVAGQTATDDVVGQTLPSSATDADMEKDAEVSDTSGIVAESSQDVAATSTPANIIIHLVPLTPLLTLLP